MNHPVPPDLSALPYRDTKPHGAADFYFAFNPTFRFIRAKLGMEGLIAYWKALGSDYMRPVWTRWKERGLEGIEAYWRAFFSVEPGGEVDISRSETAVVLSVAVCPAIKHLREHGRTLCPEFCQHCYYVSEAAAQKAGYTVRVQGGNGSCRQTFSASDAVQPPQDIREISVC